MLEKKELHRILNYNHKTGEFRWRIKSSVNIKIGSVAGTLNSSGYVHIVIKKKQYKAHRLAFLYMTGELPSEEVDHINRIKNDNCWENLRECTHTQNQANTAMSKNNSSGFKGVSWYSPRRKWVAYIGCAGKRLHLGYFDCKLDAAKTYNGKALELHGDMAYLNNIEIFET